MPVRRYPTPLARSPAVNKDGTLTVEWQRYLGGLEDVSGRVAANIDALDGAATLADVRAKVNELLTAMQTAKQQET